MKILSLLQIRLILCEELKRNYGNFFSIQALESNDFCKADDKQCFDQCREELTYQTQFTDICSKPNEPCSILPNVCFNLADKSDRSITDKIQKRIDEAQGSNKYVSFAGVSVPLSKINTEILQCKRGTPTWWVFPIDKSKLPNHPTECIDDLELGNDVIGKNITFTCESCFMADSKMIEFPANLPAQFNRRCRSQSFQNPIFDTPHSQMKVAVKMDHFCIGNRKFERFVECNVHTGRKWSHACLLSVFTGGFGGDRFYLKYWRSGLGKLLTFGGLGIWTVIDIFLVCSGYIGPEDGSLYVW